MSERRGRRSAPGRRPRGGRSDGGFTLIEMLLSVVLMGTLVSVISFTTITILKTRASSAGRANNARSEQVIGVWMPGDLASAEAVDTSPSAVPCGPTPACPSGAEI